MTSDFGRRYDDHLIRTQEHRSRRLASVFITLTAALLLLSVLAQCST